MEDHGREAQVESGSKIQLANMVIHRLYNASRLYNVFLFFVVIFCDVFIRLSFGGCVKIGVPF